MMAASSFRRLVRFIPKVDEEKVLIGQPIDDNVDVGVALYEGKEVKVEVFSGTSVLNPGQATDQVETIGRVLSPLSEKEVGTIRCIGLNYHNHAKEVNFPVPTVPTLFLKPATALADPWPSSTIIPKWTIKDNCADYESELVIVLGKKTKDVSEADALDHVLGYTAANDVSSRASQFAQTQWCFSKGFDGSCPLGPVLASTALIPDPTRLKVRGLKNGAVMQDGGVDDMIFDVPKIVSFCSQGTTLPPGTLILTGTPAGVGVSRKPQELLSDGDEFAVEILPHIGTLITKYQNEK